MNTNWFEKLFINEAKPALDRHAGGGGGNSLGVPAIEVATADEMDTILANSTVSDTGTVYYYTGESTDKYAQGSHYVLIGEAKLQDKEVTQNGEVTPDEGYDGLGKVSVKTESSLKKLLDVTKKTQSWFSSLSDITDFSDIIAFNDTSSVTNMADMFNNCARLTVAPLFDTSSVTNMAGMFSSCSSLITVPLYDTKAVTTINAMFRYSSKLTTVPLFDTKAVTNINAMFSYCSSLNTVPMLDIRSATTTINMFEKCYKLANVYIKNIKTSITIGSGTSYGHLLTMDSLLNLLNETVYTTSAKTLTLGSANLAKFTGEYEYVKKTGKYLDLDDNETTELVNGQTKIPVVWCSSTDEGAMKVADYMTEKGWALA